MGGRVRPHGDRLDTPPGRAMGWLLLDMKDRDAAGLFGEGPNRRSFFQAWRRVDQAGDGHGHARYGWPTVRKEGHDDFEHAALTARVWPAE